VAVNGIYASIIPSYKYNLVLKSFSYGTQVMGHPVFSDTGSIQWNKGRRNPKRAYDVIENVRHQLEENPKKSFTHLSQEINFSIQTCRPIDFVTFLFRHPFKT
jgi:hypothetical protein